MAHSLNVNRAYLYTWLNKEVYKTQKIQFELYVHRRMLGEPLAYILGYKEFWSLNFKVSPSVLIPRPETETLVEELLKRIPSTAKDIKILDLGTGSGAIAIALALERPHWEIVASDRSVHAIHLARENARSLGVHNIEFIVGDWFAALKEPLPFHAIVSNPPYIAENDVHLDQLTYEPLEALVSKEEGFADLRHIIGLAPCYLGKDAWLLLEHGANQGFKVQQLLQKQQLIEVETIQDLSGVSRVTLARKP